MKNKIPSRKKLLFASIAFFVIFLLWMYFARFIMFKGEPINDQPIWPWGIFSSLIAAIVWYFSMLWWYKHNLKKKGNVQNNIDKTDI